MPAPCRSPRRTGLVGVGVQHRRMRRDQGDQQAGAGAGARGLIGSRESRWHRTCRRGRMAARDPLPAARRADRRDRVRARHDRGDRARHRFRPRLPRLAGCCHGQFLPASMTPRPGSSGSTARSRRHRLPDPRAGGLAFLDHRDRRSILWPSIAAVLLVGFQAWLGPRDGAAREHRRVRDGPPRRGDGPRRPARVPARPAGYPARLRRRGGSQRFTLLAAFAAAATFALLLFGSQRDRARRRPRLPRLAADERLAPPGR